MAKPDNAMTLTIDPKDGILTVKDLQRQVNAFVKMMNAYAHESGMNPRKFDMEIMSLHYEKEGANG